MSTFLKNLRKDPDGNFTYTNEEGARIRVPANTSKAQALGLLWDECQAARPKRNLATANEAPPAPTPTIKGPQARKPKAPSTGRPGDDSGAWGKISNFLQKINPINLLKKSPNKPQVTIPPPQATKQRVSGAYAQPMQPTAVPINPPESNLSKIEETENGYSIVFEDGVEAVISADSPAGKKIAMAMQMVRQIDENISRADEGVPKVAKSTVKEQAPNAEPISFNAGVEQKKSVKGELIMLGFSRSGAPMFGVNTNGTTIPLPAVGVEALELKKIMDTLEKSGGKIQIEGNVEPMDVLKPKAFIIETKDGAISDFGWDKLSAKDTNTWNFNAEQTENIADPVTHEPTLDAGPKIKNTQNGEPAGPIGVQNEAPHEDDHAPFPEEPGETINAYEENITTHTHTPSPSTTPEANEVNSAKRKPRVPIAIKTHEEADREDAEKSKSGVEMDI
jgi:hypothetical protein